MHRLDSVSYTHLDVYKRQVGALNEQISAGNIGNIILAQEAIMEKELGNIAEQIAALPDKKLIMIAGPSSSGKTTFCRLYTSRCV